MGHMLMLGHAVLDNSTSILIQIFKINLSERAWLVVGHMLSLGHAVHDNVTSILIQIYKYCLLEEAWFAVKQHWRMLCTIMCLLLLTLPTVSSLSQVNL